MLYHPEIIVYLWFLPVTIWVLIPLALRAAGLSLQLANRLLFISGENTVEISENRNKRRDPRLNISPIAVKVTDGDHFHTATIKNISRIGICLKNLPEKLFNKADRLTVIIKEKEKNHHTLRVQPVWATTGASGQKIGARIETASSEWLHFIKQCRQNMTLSLS